jgi:hypothetical protein
MTFSIEDHRTMSRRQLQEIKRNERVRPVTQARAQNHEQATPSDPQTPAPNGALYNPHADSRIMAGRQVRK